MIVEPERRVKEYVCCGGSKVRRTIDRKEAWEMFRVSRGVQYLIQYNYNILAPRGPFAPPSRTGYFT